MATSFGELLKAGRRARKITLRKLGELVGITHGYLSEIEAGKKLPPKEPETIENLAIVLGLDKDELQESAKVVRATHGSRLFDKIIGSDGELAWGFYRATQTSSPEDLRAALKTVLANLNKETS